MAGFVQYENKEIVPALGKEVSWASSSYYDKYTLRPYNPADLYQQKGNYDLYDDMREDDQISSALTLKKLIVLNSSYVFESENDDIVEFLEYCFNEYLDDIFIKKLYEILTALDYGFSVTEKIFDIAKDGDFKDKIVLSKLKTRAPHTFEFQTDDKGNLDTFIQYTDGEDVTLDRSRFIIYTYQKEFDNWYGNSDLNKGVYRAWWSKNAIIKFWNIYLERFGMPTHIGKMPRKGGAGEKAAFMKVVKNIQSKTGITIPDDFDIDLLQVGQGAGEYEAAINKYDSMIARKLLIPDLMGFSGGQTSGGSYALGKEQFNIFYTLIQYIRKDLEKIINREFISPLVLWNFGSKNSATFRFNQIDEERKEKDLKMWLEAVKTGKIPIVDDQINWFLGQVNAPEIDKKELEEIRAEKEAFKETLANGKGDGQSNDNTSDGVVKDDTGRNEKNRPDESPGDNGGAEEDKKEDFQKDVEGPKEYARYNGKTLTSFEQRIDFAKIDKDMRTLEEKYADEMGKTFRLIVNALIDDIRRRKIVENKKLELVNKLKLKHLGNLQRLFNTMTKDGFQSGVSSVKKNFVVTEVQTLDDSEVMEWLKQYNIYLTGVEEAEILKKVKGVLIDGIRNGSGTREIIRMIDNALKGYDIALGAARIKTITRTVINKAFNQARLNEWKELINIGEVTAFQYSAILDDRTTDICTELHGKIFKPSESEYYNPPNHFNCRSLLVPVFVDEKYELSEMPGTTQNNGDFLELSK